MDERQAHIATYLRALLSLQEWDIFEQQLEELEMKSLESLVTATGDWRYLQGRIQGLREARSLPTVYLERMKHA